MKAVECKNITKVFRTEAYEVHALRGIDLEVKTGELLLLVGPSGSGKTTLISIIAGIMHQTSGDCHVLETNLNALPENQRTQFRGKNIGFVFQSFNLIPMLSCSENVAVPLILNGVERNEALTISHEILSRLGLEERTDHFPHQLSGGQQQRIAIARSFVHNPKVIVCDEPTSSLDIDTGKQVMELLKSSVKKYGRTVIVVTHDIRIFPYADRIAKIEEGKIISIETPKPDIIS
jgi:putative ABC transport system ATP-binding protein